MKKEADMFCRDAEGSWKQFEKYILVEMNKQQVEALDSDTAETIALLSIDKMLSCTSFPQLLLVKIFTDIELAFRFFTAQNMATFVQDLKKHSVVVNTHSVKVASRKRQLLDTPTSPPSLKKTNAIAAANKERRRGENRENRGGQEEIGDTATGGRNAVDAGSSGDGARGAENSDPNIAATGKEETTDNKKSTHNGVTTRPPVRTRKLRSFKLPDMKKKCSKII